MSRLFSRKLRQKRPKCGGHDFEDRPEMKRHGFLFGLAFTACILQSLLSFAAPFASVAAQGIYVWPYNWAVRKGDFDKAESVSPVTAYLP